MEEQKTREIAIGEHFWKDRKENFIKLKLWDDNRMNITQNLATLLIGMLGILMQRIENSATENETFVEYFQSYVKIWNDHSLNIEKNAQKFLMPMRIEHEKQGSKFKEFMHQVESMDLIYA